MVTLWGVPRSLGRSVLRLFRGSRKRVAWKLLLATVGTAVLVALLSASATVAAVVAGLFVSAAWSDNVRRIYLDIWHMRWYKT